MVVLLVDVGWFESKALSVSGDRAFDATKVLLCCFVWPTLSVLQKNLKSGVVVAIDSGSFSHLEVTTPVRNLFSDEFPVLFVEFIRQPLEVIPDHVQVDPRECDHCWFAIRVVANDGEISVSLSIFRGRCQFDSDLHLWAFC